MESDSEHGDSVLTLSTGRSEVSRIDTTLGPKPEHTRSKSTSKCAPKVGRKQNTTKGVKARYKRGGGLSKSGAANASVALALAHEGQRLRGEADALAEKRRELAEQGEAGPAPRDPNSAQVHAAASSAGAPIHTPQGPQPPADSQPTGGAPAPNVAAGVAGAMPGTIAAALPPNAGVPIVAYALPDHEPRAYPYGAPEHELPEALRGLQDAPFARITFSTDGRIKTWMFVVAALAFWLLAIVATGHHPIFTTFRVGACDRCHKMPQTWTNDTMGRISPVECNCKTWSQHTKVWQTWQTHSTGSEISLWASLWAGLMLHWATHHKVPEIIRYATQLFMLLGLGFWELALGAVVAGYDLERGDEVWLVCAWLTNTAVLLLCAWRTWRPYTTVSFDDAGMIVAPAMSAHLVNTRPVLATMVRHVIVHAPTRQLHLCVSKPMLGFLDTRHASSDNTLVQLARYARAWAGAAYPDTYEFAYNCLPVPLSTAIYAMARNLQLSSDDGWVTPEQLEQVLSVIGGRSWAMGFQ